MREASFQIYKDASGMFRFRLVAPNGEIVAVSEGFKSKDVLLKRIELLKMYAPKADIEQDST